MKSLGNGQWCVISAVQVKYLIPYLVASHDVITNCDNISFRSCGIHAEELGLPIGQNGSPLNVFSKVFLLDV